MKPYKTITSETELTNLLEQSILNRYYVQDNPTLPDNYTNHVSDAQRYKALGNGWTVDVIAHIFSYIPR